MCYLILSHIILLSFLLHSDILDFLYILFLLLNLVLPLLFLYENYLLLFSDLFHMSLLILMSLYIFSWFYFILFFFCCQPIFYNFFSFLSIFLTCLNHFLLFYLIFNNTYKNIWDKKDTIININFKRDHKNQKRIQCSIKNEAVYNILDRFYSTNILR